MSEASPPRRRWYRFGLGTILLLVAVLAVFLGWLTWELTFVRERAAFIERGKAQAAMDHPGAFQVVWPDPPGSKHRQQPTPVPFWRKWLGDETVAAISVLKEDQMEEARRLFPEAVAILNFETDRIDALPP